MQPEPNRERVSLAGKRIAMEQDISNGKDPFESFKSHFNEVSGSYCGGKFNVENTMVGKVKPGGCVIGLGNSSWYCKRDETKF